MKPKNTGSMATGSLLSGSDERHGRIIYHAEHSLRSALMKQQGLTNGDAFARACCATMNPRCFLKFFEDHLHSRRFA